MQKLWDANGAAIYEANQEYQAKHGKEMDAGSRSKAIKDATVNGVFNAGAYASNLETAKTRQEAQNERMANKMTRVEREEEVRWQASQKTAEEKKAQDLQEGLAAYYAAMRQGEQEAKPNWWEQTKSFVREKIVQPYIQPVVTALDEKLYQPYFKPTLDTIKRSQAYQAAQNSITPKKIATVALTLALGANTVQWVNNLKSNPDVFSPARDYAQSLVDDLRLKHPPAPEKHSLAYIVSHPYDVMATGSDFLNTLISIGASYADAIWQQNPLTQLAVESLETLEDSLCSRITSQAWANRCTAAFYLSAGLTATPFDTTLGVANSFVVDPIVGFLKQGALSIETYAAIPDLVTAIREEGWEGAKDFVAELWTNRLEIVLNDKQMQSAFFVECLILFALIAAPLAGVVILGMTAKGLIELDAAVTASKNKKSLIELVTSHEVRTTVVSSALILALMTAGLSKQVSEFRAFQERLSPSAQTSFQTLSLLEQTRLADLASKMKLSPGAMEFYLTETARPGSPLAELPLTDALRVSNLAAESGRGAFVLDYISRYGVDAAIKNASPEGLTFYLEQAKTPGSMMSSLTPQQGVIVRCNDLCNSKSATRLVTLLMLKSAMT